MPQWRSCRATTTLRCDAGSRKTRLGQCQSLTLRSPNQVHKTVWRLRTAAVRVAALQFPEGLLMYACILADIFQTCAPCPVRSSHWR